MAKLRRPPNTESTRLSLSELRPPPRLYLVHDGIPLDSWYLVGGELLVIARPRLERVRALLPGIREATEAELGRILASIPGAVP